MKTLSMACCAASGALHGSSTNFCTAGGSLIHAVQDATAALAMMAVQKAVEQQQRAAAVKRPVVITAAFAVL
jgi:hypothetical protein